MQWARRHLVLPLADEPDAVRVAIADPGSALAALDDLRFVFGRPVRIQRMAADALRAAIDRAYDDAAGAAASDAALGERLELPEAPLEDVPDLLEAGDDAPAIRFVNAVLCEAVRAGASDVHVEPSERRVGVRFRIDGVLHDVVEAPLALHGAVVARTKIMAGLDIAERRLPQDGRIAVRVGGRDVDVRVSVVPTTGGERLVLRLLDRASIRRDLGALGLGAAALAGFETLLARSHGFVLVTGPTGSGKTTTLYAALARLAAGTRNVLTIEDPVEYRLAGIGQMEVRPRIGLDFAAGLRAILRQDPDVILVGEIRDRETMEIAIRAALTGHLVLATLHTSDAAGALTRLLDMGAEPYLVASAVTGVLAQRLVRVRCADCDGRGCGGCRGTGYRGRTGLYELLLPDDGLRARLLERADTATLRRHAGAAGLRTLDDDGRDKIAAGVTTAAEVRRVIEDGEVRG
ncbi:MAG: Flp pilus assembly complex ATPase component TadA [bacterium]|nr:Flp pilus assembly complex ATPase component TadA [bacterium]